MICLFLNAPAAQNDWDLPQDLGRALSQGIYFVQRVDARGNTLATKRVTMIK